MSNIKRIAKDERCTCSCSAARSPIFPNIHATDCLVFLRSHRWLDWEKLKETISDWADEKFGAEPHVSRIKHLREEVDELQEAFYAYEVPGNRKDAVAEELADIFIIGFHIARTEGINLFEVIQDKFSEIKKRTWLPPDHEGVIRHKK